MDKILHAILSKAGAAWSGGGLLVALIVIMINHDIETDRRVAELEKNVQLLKYQMEMIIAKNENG